MKAKDLVLAMLSLRDLGNSQKKQTVGNTGLALRKEKQFGETGHGVSVYQ